MIHLNEEQIAELVVACPSEPGSADAQSHAGECPECTAEVARMRDSLALFREAGTACADAHLNRMPAWHTPATRPAMPQAAYWAAAAAAIFLASLPMQMNWRHAWQTPAAMPIAAVAEHTAAESDDALLEDVNRELSASVPTPMQSLADPTGDAAGNSRNSTQRTN